MFDDDPVDPAPGSPAHALGEHDAQDEQREGAEWDPPRPRPRRRWVWIGAITALSTIVVAVAGWFVRLPYYTISPGSSLDVNERITVKGAPSYQPDGEVRLLFVRQRARVNVWRWLQASLDEDVDLFKEEEFTGGQSPDQVRDEARADMVLAQYSARTVAMRALGYDIDTERDGVRVLYVFADLPAYDLLEEGDVIVAVDGEAVDTSQELGEAIGLHEAGENAEITYVRDGERRTAQVPTEAALDDGRPVIGVQAVPPYDFPVDVEIDTDRIGGPSAGLAMTLSIIDELTPGELTGGQVVAVTGTIDLDGHVGEIGGIAQKAGSARAAHASLFLVPECHDGPYKDECVSDLERARRRAGEMQVVEVATVDEALEALDAAGGEPVEPSA